MKNIFLTIITGLLFFSSCSSDTAVSPKISVVSYSVNTKVVSEIPSVKVGDVVEVSLNLEGNGSDLVSFQANADKKEEIKMSLADYEKNNVSNEPNFTDTTECQLRFVDGVTVSNVKVKATVQAIQDDQMALKFYLSAKADCEGSVLEIDLKKDNTVK